MEYAYYENVKAGTVRMARKGGKGVLTLKRNVEIRSRYKSRSEVTASSTGCLWTEVVEFYDSLSPKNIYT